MKTPISNDNLAALLNAGNCLSLFIWEDVPGWPVLFVSDNVEALLGYPKDQLMNRDIEYQSLVHEEDLPRVLTEVEALTSLESGESITHEDYRLKHANGHDIWVSDTTVVITDDDGVNYLYGYLIDITERKQLELALETERNRLKLLLDATRLGTWEWNPQTGVTLYNERWAQMFGWELHELEAHVANWSSILHPDDYEQVWESIKNHLDGVTPYYESEHRIRHRNGSWVYVLDRGKVIEHDENGRATRFTGTVTDLTEQKQSELDAKRAAHAKNVFLANMSHEIRTPLHGILGVTSVLEASELNSKQRDLVETIKDSGDYLLTTLNDILDLTKAEEGQLKLVLGSHSPKKVLEHIAHLFEKPIVDKGLKFTLNIAPDIPEVTQMDQSRTAQVVSNLVNNAMKFTETGEISLSASWDLESDFVGELIIEVKDTGVGIENTQRIWQLFEQEKYGLNRPKGGSGLGLAIVRSLVQLLDGTIRVDSVPGEGSCFTVVLPMRTQTGASAHTPKRELPSLATHRVLVVDDNRVNQLIIKEMLMSLGQKVEIVSNAEKAFKLFGTHSYDALFMDVHMPNIDGMQATQKLRGMKIKQPYIVALTADAFPETRRQAIDAGMDDYVTKPFVKMDIAEALKRFEERQNSHTHKRLR